jgi:molybdopterin converting factor small subunit
METKAAGSAATAESSSKMTLNVLMFARAREIVGKSSLKVEVASGCSVKTLVAHVLKLYPAIAALMKNMVLSLNLDYIAADSEQVLKPSDEVRVSVHLRAALIVLRFWSSSPRSRTQIAFIPPISGG